MGNEKRDGRINRRPRGGMPTTRVDTGASIPKGAVSPWVQLRSASRHPFLYQKMIRGVDPTARPGDVVNIYDKSGFLFGRGLYNPRSTIALRVLSLGSAPVDELFWRSKLHSATALRERIGVAESSDAYRLVHAEGDGLSGLIVERYADCLVFEIFSLGMFQRRELLAAILADQVGSPQCLDRPDRSSPTWRIHVRADEFIERTEGFSAAELDQLDIPPFVIREHGIRYRIDVRGGHKTGFFCDQRDNRLRLSRMCRDAEVLDLCCYTGGFALCAKVLGGAREVTAVDLDEWAIEQARENANLNQTRLNLIQADAFTYLRQMLGNQRRYDVVVLDPPKFAPSRDDLKEAEHKYYDLNALALRVVKPGGILVTCSCSGLVSREVFTSIVDRAARLNRLNLQILDHTGAGPDHPVSLDCPESSYLKVFWARVNGPE